MIFILRSNDVNPDPRVQKYIDFYEEKKIKYKVIAWQRNSKKYEEKNFTYIKIKSDYGLRSQNIKNLIYWNILLLKELFKNRDKITIIHSCDFDTILPAIAMKILYRKKIIYDIFDWYVDSRDIYNTFLGKIIEKIEKTCVKKADYVIICDEGRKKQIDVDHKRMYIYQNVPNFKTKKMNHEKKIEKIKIGYVGILGLNRGLIELVKVVKDNKDLQLDIAGFGDLEIELKKEIVGQKNIKFYGKVEYSKGLEILSKSHLIYGMYYKTSRNNIFAAPNKYYESLYLGVPLLTNEGTLTSEKVSKCRTGYIIQEGENSLREFFEKFKIDDTHKRYINNCKNIWENEYKNYNENFFEEIYLKKIILEK